MSSLIQEAKEGKVRFYNQFGGQGTPWFKELEKYYKADTHKKFFATLFDSLEEEKHRVEGSIGLPLGIDIKKWLNTTDKNELPSESYLSSASVSLPMVQATQFAHLENLLQSGVSIKELLNYSLGATGHSQGIVSATFLALGLEGDAYYEAISKFMKFILYVGVCSQKVFSDVNPTKEEIEISNELGGGEPSPMVAVLGSDHNTIEEFVKEINLELPKDKQIYISLYNTPSNRILSSHRSSLIAFHKKYHNKIQEKLFKYVYLSITCPFHSIHMEPMRKFFERELNHINFTYTGKDLKLPIYSFYDDFNYQEIKTPNELAFRMNDDLVLNTLFWNKAMKHIASNNNITHIIDFGPGKTSQRLSAETLKIEFQIEKVILSAIKDKIV